MGRKPIELTDEQKGEVETLGALLNQDQIADYLGISRTTFQAMLLRDPGIAERYKRGKAKAIAHVARGLLQKARSGDTVSSIFFLKTQAGWCETAKVEHSGGTSLEVRQLDTTLLSDTTLAELMAARRSALERAEPADRAPALELKAN